MWTGALTTTAQERAIVQNMADALDEEYAQLREAIEQARQEKPTVPRRTLTRLRRQFRDIVSRDYFGSPKQRALKQDIERLARVSAGVPR